MTGAVPSWMRHHLCVIMEIEPREELGNESEWNFHGDHDAF
jgi:hypothetical protein